MAPTIVRDGQFRLFFFSREETRIQVGRPPGPGWWYAFIFTSPGQASCRRSRLTSNVRRLIMLSSLITIALLHWAVLLVPGFNFILIGQLAASGSRRSALAAVVGMTTATLVWAVLAIAGVGAVFTAQPALRQVAQIAGGAYLLYLAFQLLRSGALRQPTETKAAGPSASFRAGFVTSALNPKIALFYGSVFATALPAQPSAAHIASAVLLVYANSWVWHGSLAFLLSLPGVQRTYLRHYTLLTKASALLVGAFGVKLIATAIQEARTR